MSSEEKRLTLKVFTWVVGTMITVWACAYGYTWVRLSSVEAKSENASREYVSVSNNLGKISSDIEWIKATLQGKYK